jgi:hypothetical protein
VYHRAVFLVCSDCPTNTRLTGSINWCTVLSGCVCDGTHGVRCTCVAVCPITWLYCFPQAVRSVYSTDLLLYCCPCVVEGGYSIAAFLLKCTCYIQLTHLHTLQFQIACPKKIVQISIDAFCQ